VLRSLSALRKHGPITDLWVSRDPKENRWLIRMGYQSLKLTEHTPENTIWICRLCFGTMSITEIKEKAV